MSSIYLSLLGTMAGPMAMDSELQFDEMVQSVGLIVKEIHPDGNCLFSAVVDQLRISGDFSYTAHTLRQATVDFLTKNPCQVLDILW